MVPTEQKPLLPRYNVFEELLDGEQLFFDDQNTGAGVLGVVPFNRLLHHEHIHEVAHFFRLSFLHSGPRFGADFAGGSFISAP